jgi:hypothetical protein
MRKKSQIQSLEKMQIIHIHRRDRTRAQLQQQKNTVQIQSLMNAGEINETIDTR